MAGYYPGPGVGLGSGHGLDSEPQTLMKASLTRRELLRVASLGAGAAALGAFAGCEKSETTSSPAATRDRGTRKSYADEEYVWLSANANLPLFTTRDHPALRLAGTELGVKVSLAGPSSVDIPGLVAAIEQT